MGSGLPEMTRVDRNWNHCLAEPSRDGESAVLMRMGCKYSPLNLRRGYDGETQSRCWWSGKPEISAGRHQAFRATPAAVS